MKQRLIAALIVVGLAVGVWMLWPEGDSDPTTTTVPVAAPTSVETTTAPTSTVPATTSTTATDSHVVTTVEEAEAILRDLWFGWFEGIYNQDEDRIREVVGSQQMLDSARAAFGDLSFEPMVEAIALSDLEILRSDADCLVVWATLDVTAMAGADADESSVHVLRSLDSDWRFMSIWVHANDLWEADCESQLEPLA